MTAAFLHNQDRLDLYEAVGCGVSLTSGADRREQRRLERDRRVCDRADRLFKRAMNYQPKTREDAFAIVRGEWDAAGIPLIGWVFWQAVAALVQRVVFYLWDRYHSSESPPDGLTSTLTGESDG
jgi:hypothetical protein